ncbi:carbon-nitrogen hydrolase family protein [Halomicroarcula sp. GCM10025324]|uniref:carbon-nitrogen hydrolase family protein n=1 Tax=Haloarcula TaxID=2237 RepID=UPI0023E80A09|nr:carbon-nitrogen hydrolase family protein [Halomicroarcula sp. ZS-22-S1]
MGDEYQTVTAAAVQAAPVFLDREASVEKAVGLIEEAGANDADVIAFPEGFIPAHPLWFHFHGATSQLSQSLSVELFKNSIEVPGPSTERLAAAADAADAYVVIGACEKEPQTTGTMYNSQLFFSPDGELLGTHQKLKPTVGEQLVHTEGENDTFGTIDTEYGPMSGLICGENSNPLAVFGLTAEYSRIHAMSWPPYIPSESNPLPERSLDDAKAFAQMSKAAVISSVGVVDERTVEKLQVDDETAEKIMRPEYSGGSAIVGADRSVIAGPVGNEETILYGDIDIETAIRRKLFHDFAGHYNRPDVFQLRVNRTPNELYAEASTAAEAADTGQPPATETESGTTDGIGRDAGSELVREAVTEDHSEE